MNDIQLNYLMKRFQPFLGEYLGKMNWKILKLQDIHLLSYPMNQILDLEAHIGLHYILMCMGIVTYLILMGVCPCGNLRVNRIQLQSYNSDVCGHYCICFLSKRITEKIPMEKVLAIFNEDTKLENNKFVFEYVVTKFII